MRKVKDLTGQRFGRLTENEPLAYIDNQPVLLTPVIADATLDLSMRIVPDDRGVYLYRKELKQWGES